MWRVLFFFLLLLSSCRLAPRGVWINTGESQISSADGTMRQEGATLTPYESFEEQFANPECIRQGNEILRDIFKTRYQTQIEIPSPDAPAPATQPTPLYRIEISDIRCQAITSGSPNANLSYRMKGKPKEIRGEVKISIYNRATNDLVIEIVGRETAGTAETAIQKASQQATLRLFQGNNEP